MADNSTDNRVIGIDLGGTHLKVGVRDSESPTLLKTVTRPALCGENAEKVFNNIFEAIKEVTDGKPPKNYPIGLCMPGDINNVRGIVTSRRFGFVNFPFVEKFAESDFRVIGMNDAQASGIGELTFGAGKDFADMAVITLGTSIGGAFILQRRVLKSSSGLSVGIIAHLTIDPNGPVCRCGKKGCWEVYCNRAAILSQAQELGLNNDLDVGDIARLVHTDQRARDTFQTLADYLAKGIVTLIDMLAPQAVILSGGVSQAGSILTDRIQVLIAPHIRENRKVVVLTSELGDKSGIYGTTVVAQQGDSF